MKNEEKPMKNWVIHTENDGYIFVSAPTAIDVAHYAILAGIEFDKIELEKS